MDTRKLAIFNDLAETQNYSRTAERMFLSQSTISKHIMSLEKEWDVKLFIRVHRQVKLTSAGKLLLPKVKEVLEQSNDLQQMIEDQVWLTERPLIIQEVPSFSYYQGAQMVANFMAEYPQIKIKFSEHNVDQLEHALDQKNVDVVFTRIFHDNFPAYNLLKNETDELVVLMSKDNSLSQQVSVTIDQLKTQPLLLFKDGISKSNPVYNKLQDIYTSAKISYDGQQKGLILDMINQNIGVSVAMKGSVDLTDYPQIKAVPLEPKIENHLAFMKQRDNTSAVVSLFWKFLEEQTHQFFAK